MQDTSKIRCIIIEDPSSSAKMSSLVSVLNEKGVTATVVDEKEFKKQIESIPGSAKVIGLSNVMPEDIFLTAKVPFEYMQHPITCPSKIEPWYRKFDKKK